MQDDEIESLFQEMDYVAKEGREQELQQLLSPLPQTAQCFQCPVVNCEYVFNDGPLEWLNHHVYSVHSEQLYQGHTARYRCPFAAFRHDDGCSKYKWRWTELQKHVWEHLIDDYEKRCQQEIRDRYECIYIVFSKEEAHVSNDGDP